MSPWEGLPPLAAWLLESLLSKEKASSSTGGSSMPRPTRSNPTHCEMCGITAGQAEDLFTPTVRNPNKQ